MNDAPRHAASRRFHVFGYLVLLAAFLFSARAPAALHELLLEAPKVATNLCDQKQGDCQWRSQGQIYADCPLPTGLGYGCLWRCRSFWCASSSVLDRGSSRAAAVASKDVCTVTASANETLPVCADERASNLP